MVGDGRHEAHGLLDDGYGHVVESEGAVVQFMLGGGEDPGTVDNVDAHLHLADGSHRYATFFTLDAVREILRRHANTGETGGGRYFWCSDQVIVPEPGVAAMVAAVDEMIRSGDIEVMCGRIEEEIEEVPGAPDAVR
ncbi:hypothetical protein AB0B85_11165 [Micromonospora sp. NPDC049044]|uniref:hypothetical protein n=1 Tax=Micromonospora sp. NPDC049044 TaxID=3154827 RepID=UPI00341188B5